ncbi:MAG: hypothetical protein NAG76_22060 [Candidatus Pristimantibacillus lignocellulolyticus]|uniref:Septation ring formation regulator EzrA n=1 Tax=Candidatus Pristimantibacillus lignocellulolyticus TaxID=2994561 RepID=A0A9J6ZEL1_9BACL|nr:MAG: hypothetical protein NAG76_22060 [Candidatus Pristimantibacillus lignocellulolyticus]
MNKWTMMLVAGICIVLLQFSLTTQIGASSATDQYIYDETSSLSSSEITLLESQIQAESFRLVLLVNTTSAQGIALIFGLIIVVAIVIIFMVQSRKRRRYNEDVDNLTDELETVLGKVHELEDGLTTALKFSQGHSKAIIEASENELYTLLQRATTYPEQLRSLKPIPRWISSKHVVHLKELMYQVKQQLQLANRLEDVFHSYNNEISIATKVLQDYQLSFNQAKQNFETMNKNNEMTLIKLSEKQLDIQKMIDQCAALLAFNPVEAKVQLDQYGSQITTWCSDINEYTSLVSEVSKLPNKINETKLKIDELVHQERLKLDEISPYKFFDSMNGQLASMKKALNIGDMIIVRDGIQRINNWLTTSLAEVKQSIDARNRNQQVLNQFKLAMIQYEKDHHTEITKQINALQLQFHEIHWRNAAEQLTELQRNVEMLKEQMDKAENYNSFEVQRYLESDNILQEANSLLQAIQDSSAQLLHIHERSEQRVREYLTTCGQLKKSIVQLRSTAQSHVVYSYPGIHETECAASSSIQILENAVSLTPRNLYHANEQLRDATQKVNEFENLVKQAVDNKMARERAEEERL